MTTKLFQIAIPITNYDRTIIIIITIIINYMLIKLGQQLKKRLSFIEESDDEFYK